MLRVSIGDTFIVNICTIVVEESVSLSIHPQVQEKHKVTVQYSGDQPPSLQELVDSGQLPKEALEDEVVFEKVAQ